MNVDELKKLGENHRQMVNFKNGKLWFVEYLYPEPNNITFDIEQSRFETSLILHSKNECDIFFCWTTKIASKSQLFHHISIEDIIHHKINYDEDNYKIKIPKNELTELTLHYGNSIIDELVDFRNYYGDTQ